MPWDAMGTKSDNRTWLHKDSPRKQVVRPTAMTNRKTLLLVAFTPNKRFSVTAMPRGSSIDANCMVDFLRRTGDLWRTLRSNPIHLKELRLQMDNARPHSAHVVRDFIDQRSLTTIWQSPYSPDLNLCDRFLFTWLKNELRLRTFNSSDEVETAALQAFKAFDENCMHSEVDKLYEHCQLVINAEGHYITE